MGTHTIYSFRVGDVEDPESMVMLHLNDWSRSELGRWIWHNASSLRYTLEADEATMGHRVDVMVDLRDDQYIYCRLAFG